MKRHSTTFWEELDKLVATSRLVIDRPKGTHHPNFPEMFYPLDYGYLENTTSMDGHGIDVWRGTSPTKTIDAVIITIDLIKRDSEIKILIGCTPADKKLVMNFHNQSELMRGLLIER
jgi:inorganic pyrophosphatase